MPLLYLLLLLSHCRVVSYFPLPHGKEGLQLCFFTFIMNIISIIYPSVANTDHLRNPAHSQVKQCKVAMTLEDISLGMQVGAQMLSHPLFLLYPPKSFLLWSSGHRNILLAT